ncbi:MAG TPA: hypothetical protein VNJ11_08790 [Bryobacteraceae bacterium]|nr:hypothetical protein [Bryobacteraceae bacterium]
MKQRSAGVAIRRGDLLPDVALPLIRGGRIEPLRPAFGRTTVLLILHEPFCPSCQHYLDELGELSEEFSIWEGRLLVVAPDTSPAYRCPGFGLPVRDPENRLGTRGMAYFLVADRYGQVWEAAPAGDSHPFPPPREITEWLKYLGTLCPE